MKAIRSLSAGLLLLTLGFAAPVRSQQQDDKNKQPPPKQEAPKQAPAQHTTPQPRQAPPPKQQPTQQPKEQPKQQPTKAPTTQHSAPPHSTPQQAYGGAYHGGVKSTAPTNGGVHPSGVPQHSGQVRSGFAQSKAGNWSSDHRRHCTNLAHLASPGTRAEGSTFWSAGRARKWPRR